MKFLFVTIVVLGICSNGCEQDDFIDNHVSGSVEPSSINTIENLKIGIFEMRQTELNAKWFSEIEQVVLQCDYRKPICEYKPIKVLNIGTVESTINYKIDLPKEDQSGNIYYKVIAWIDRNDDGYLQFDPVEIETEVVFTEGTEPHRLPEWKKGSWVTDICNQSGQWQVGGEQEDSGFSTNTTHPDNWNFTF